MSVCDHLVPIHYFNSKYYDERQKRMESLHEVGNCNREHFSNLLVSFQFCVSMYRAMLLTP